MFDNLIGSRLVAMNENGFTVQTPVGDMRHYEFVEIEGDCCGYSELTAALLFDPDDPTNNPAITNVEDSGGEDDGWGETRTITLFGISGPLARINSESSSGSGWCYGAAMHVKCRETGEEDVLTSW